MAVGLGIRFLFGRYHATAWDRHVNEGAPDWPPSPWRVLRALVATWHNRCPDIDRDVVDRLLDVLAEPPRYRLPAHSTGHTRHYYPSHDHLDGVKVSTDKIVDAFITVLPDDELIIEWDVDLGSEEMAALNRLAENVGYLGRAESACDVRVLTDEELGSAAAAQMVERAGSAGASSLRLLGLEAGAGLGTLEQSPHRVRKDRLLDPPGTVWIDYAAPQVPTQQRTPRRRRFTARPTAIRWQMVARDVKNPSGGVGLPTREAALVMTDALRAACQSQFGKQNDKAASPQLSGKSPGGDPLTGHQHAHYLALDLDGDRHLDTLVCWAPGGFTAEDVAAMSAVRGLSGREYFADFRPVLLGLEAVGSVDTVAPGYLTADQPTTQWRSVTPFVPPRHAKRRRTLVEDAEVQLREELARRSLPEPESVTPYGDKWLDFRRHRPRKQNLGAARRGFGFEVTFADPVDGPICVGMHSHYGLGLFSPV